MTLRWSHLPLLIALLPGSWSSAAGCSDLPALRADWARLLAAEPDPARLESYPYWSCFRETAERYDFPPQLLLGLAWGESAFEPAARSVKNAIGVMQIRWPGTARDLGFESAEALEDPCRNIDAGARYLRWLFDRVDGDPVLALASYNHGPNAIDGRDRNVNEHARSYVCYIYDKTLRVLSRPGFGVRELFVRLGTFTDYRMAKITLQRYERRVRLLDGVELPLEIQQGADGRYQLRVSCEDDADLSVERVRYEEITGFRPN